MVKQRTALRNTREAHTHAGVQATVADWAAADLAHLTARLREVDATLRRVLATLPQAQVLHHAVKGAGPLVVVAVLASLPVAVWGRAKAAAAGADSGQTTHAQLSRAGTARLRRVLYLAALAARRWDAELSAFVDRLIARGKAPKAALVALLHKLLRRLMGTLRSAALPLPPPPLDKSTQCLHQPSSRAKPNTFDRGRRDPTRHQRKSKGSANISDGGGGANTSNRQAEDPTQSSVEGRTQHRRSSRVGRSLDRGWEVGQTQVDQGASRPTLRYRKAQACYNEAEMAAGVDLRVYLITDPLLAGNRPLEEVVAAAIRGGVTLVQLRDKGASTLSLVRTGKRLREITAAAGVPLVVNDRVDVALAVGADGVHVGHPGQEDMPPDVCRRLLGPAAIVGVSVDQEDEARQAAEAGAGYLSSGPVYATHTKEDAGPAAGLALVRRIRQATALPLTGIGGITAQTAGDVIRAGANGVAVAGAILAAADPEAAARAIRAEVDRALAGRAHR